MDHAELRDAVVDGDVERARALARRLVDEGGDLVAAIDQGFAAGIRRVGDLFDEGEYFLPELVQGAEAMKAAMAVLEPALRGSRGEPRSRGCVVIGTVRGDLHDIGKTLVATLLAANGFEVHDLGCDVPVSRFVEKAREVRADIVAASALLTTTMPVQREIADAVAAAFGGGAPPPAPPGDPGVASSGAAAAELDHRPRILVGGAPTRESWAARIGAAHAENAMRAVAVAEELVASVRSRRE